MKFSKLSFVHWLIILVALGFAADWLIQRPDSRTREVSAAIEAQASEALRNYPYPFRVVRVTGDTVVLSTPRNVKVPAMRFLKALHPEVDTLNSNDPAYQAVQQELAKVQTEIMNLAKAQPGIKRVDWELDTAWLAKHGIDVPQ